MPVKIDIKSKNDARAKQLGFKDRFELRGAVNQLSASMSEEDWEALSSEEIEQMLKQYTKDQ